jgi:phage gp36-like protein
MAESYATQTNLEVALGGPSILLQLADLSQTGSLEDAGTQAAITDYLEVGASRVRAAVEVKHEPETIASLDAASRRLLVSWNADLSARVAWEKGGMGQVMPEAVQERADRAIADLDRLAAGTLRLGRVADGTSAGINQEADGEVDYDSLGIGMSIQGLKNSGFR